VVQRGAVPEAALVGITDIAARHFCVVPAVKVLRQPLWVGRCGLALLLLLLLALLLLLLLMGRARSCAKQENGEQDAAGLRHTGDSAATACIGSNRQIGSPLD
jgi:hypothetical protein